MRLGLREANQRFSKAIRAVRPSKEVVLTERGHPIALIKPIRDEDTEEATLRTMVDQGLITPAARKGPMPTPSWRPVKVKGKPLSQTVIEDREERA